MEKIIEKRWTKNTSDVLVPIAVEQTVLVSESVFLGDCNGPVIELSVWNNSTFNPSRWNIWHKTAVIGTLLSSREFRGFKPAILLQSLNKAQFFTFKPQKASEVVLFFLSINSFCFPFIFFLMWRESLWYYEQNIKVNQSRTLSKRRPTCGCTVNGSAV